MVIDEIVLINFVASLLLVMDGHAVDHDVVPHRRNKLVGASISFIAHVCARRCSFSSFIKFKMKNASALDKEEVNDVVGLFERLFYGFLFMAYHFKSIFILGAVSPYFK